MGFILHAMLVVVVGTIGLVLIPYIITILGMIVVGIFSVIGGVIGAMLSPFVALSQLATGKPVRF